MNSSTAWLTAYNRFGAPWKDRATFRFNKVITSEKDFKTPVQQPVYPMFQGRPKKSQVKDSPSVVSPTVPANDQVAAMPQQNANVSMKKLKDDEILKEQEKRQKRSNASKSTPTHASNSNEKTLYETLQHKAAWLGYWITPTAENSKHF